MSEETSATAEKPTKRRGGNHNPAGRNQWDRVEEAEIAGNPFAEDAAEAWREKYKAGYFIGRLAKNAAGLVELTPSQIKSAEIVLDRLEPRLSAVEQTNVNPDEAKSPLELLQELAPLLKAHPEWLRALGFVPLEPVKDASAPSEGSEAVQQQVIVSTSGASSG